MSLNQNYWRSYDVCFWSAIKFPHFESNSLDGLLQLGSAYSGIYCVYENRIMKYVTASAETTKSIVWNLYWWIIFIFKPTNQSIGSEKKTEQRKRWRTRNDGKTGNVCWFDRFIYSPVESTIRAYLNDLELNAGTEAHILACPKVICSLFYWILYQNSHVSVHTKEVLTAMV